MEIMIIFFFIGMTCTDKSFITRPEMCMMKVNRLDFMLTLSVIWVYTVGLCVHQSSDLDDDFQGFDFLVCSPGLLQRLVELFNAVHIVLLGQVQQLPLWALSTHNEQHIHKHVYQQTKHKLSPNETHLLQVVQFLQTSAHLLWHGWAGTGCFTLTQVKLLNM